MQNLDYSEEAVPELGVLSCRISCRLLLQVSDGHATVSLDMFCIWMTAGACRRLPGYVWNITVSMKWDGAGECDILQESGSPRRRPGWEYKRRVALLGPLRRRPAATDCSPRVYWNGLYVG